MSGLDGMELDLMHSSTLGPGPTTILSMDTNCKDAATACAVRSQDGLQLMHIRKSPVEASSSTGPCPCGITHNSMVGVDVLPRLKASRFQMRIAKLEQSWHWLHFEFFKSCPRFTLPTALFRSGV